MTSSDTSLGLPMAFLPGADELPLPAKALFGVCDIHVAHTEMQDQLESLAERLRVAILKCDPKQLLGFLWGQLLLGQMVQTADADEVRNQSLLDDIMFVLEYVHAVLSSHVEAEWSESSEADSLAVVLGLGAELRRDALLYCLVAAHRIPAGLFGPETGTVAMSAMTSWVTLRGRRHQALESEFFEFALTPHDEAFRLAYGVGAQEISVGLQAIVDAMRYGHSHATEALAHEAETAYALAESEGIDLAEAIQRLHKADAARGEVAQNALTSLFFGGICQVSKTSGLPASLLADLAYLPGEETEFFQQGPHRGTPLRRMPGRVKPLVVLDDEYYACDANFIRDSAYRALQWGLLKRRPEYQREWANRQTVLTEAAFQRIFAEQLAGADVLTSVYYPHPDTGKWVENDVLILLNDTLLQVEVKAGVLPMHSPDANFESHVRTIQALVVKAHEQCERFLRYAASAEEVPLYQLVAGKHQEVRRLRLSDFRLIVPIGLTMESFAPFSSMSKRLPSMHRILGRHPFISMSIDDLFVLSRFLPTTGELMHYLSVRQGVAGVLNAHVFDELDHLGSYVTQNRSDQYYLEQLAKGPSWLTTLDACAPIDAYFADPEWQRKRPPRQAYPTVLQAFLDSNELVRGPRFLQADALVRDMNGKGREDMAQQIDRLRPSLRAHAYRWFTLCVEAEPMLVWLQRDDYVDLVETHKAKAEAVCLSTKASRCKVLIIYIKSNGAFSGGWARSVLAPLDTDSCYPERLMDAERMSSRRAPLTPEGWQQITR